MIPPGGMYFYRVPETGIEFKYPTFSRLLQAVGEHYASNNIGIPPDLKAVIEDYICRHVPVGFCSNPEEGSDTTAVSLSDIRNATTALLPAGLATPGEAKRRLDICLACQYNDRRMCPTCVGLVDWAKHLVKRSLPRDEWLGVCGIDATALPAKIHIKKVPDDPAYPDTCWVRKEALEP